MTIPIEALSPWQNLALAYVKPCFRAPFELLLNLDNRLFSVAMRGSEPLFSQMRIAWWREQIAKTSFERAKGEPLLATLSELEKDHASLGLGHLSSLLVDAWEIAAVFDPDTGSIVDSAFAALRSKAIFLSYANWINAEDAISTMVLQAGQRWANLTVGVDEGKSVVKVEHVRPLSILLKGAELDCVQSPVKRRLGAVRLGIHALTGL